MHNYKQQIKKVIRKQGISYEFFAFFQSFFLFILHIADYFASRDPGLSFAKTH